MKHPALLARNALRRVQRRLNLLIPRRQCNVCKRSFHHFEAYRGGAAYLPPFVRELQMVGSDVDNCLCPACRAHDRERHQFLFFDRLKLWEHFRGGAILHFAPERNLRRAIQELHPREYIQADLFPARPEVTRVDVTSIGFPDGYFDFVLCNHVLEHVSDDRRAMSELFRVLKSPGRAIVQTPFSRLLARSFQDENINTDELRCRYYGQEDHVRVYGLDFFTRLEQAGFRLQLARHAELFSPEETTRYGVNPREDLVLALK